MTRRAAVTGIGVVAPGGTGVPAFWDLLTAGRTATRGITLFDPEGFRSRIAAECDFDPAACGLDRRGDRAHRPLRAVRLGRRATRRSTTAASTWRRPTPGGSASRWAPPSAAPPGWSRTTSRSATQATAWDVDHRRGRAAPVPRPHAQRPGLGGRRALRRARPGPDRLHRLHLGARRRRLRLQVIEEGRADVVIAGACDSPISPITVACFDAIKATSTHNDDPEHASRPFDADRDGFVLGEGAAVLILEELEQARRRGARIYCDVSGFATFGNAHHMTGLTREGLEMSQAIDRALDHGRLDRRGRGLRQRPRLGHQAERPPRDGGGQALAGRARLPDPDEVDQVDGRPLPRRHRRDRARRLRARHAPRRRPPDRQLQRPPTPSATSTTSRGTARELPLRHVLSVGSGFGGFQSAVVLSREEVAL